MNFYSPDPVENKEILELEEHAWRIQQKYSLSEPTMREISPEEEEALRDIRFAMSFFPDQDRSAALAHNFSIKMIGIAQKKAS